MKRLPFDREMLFLIVAALLFLASLVCIHFTRFYDVEWLGVIGLFLFPVTSIVISALFTFYVKANSEDKFTNRITAVLLGLCSGALFAFFLWAATPQTVSLAGLAAIGYFLVIAAPFAAVFSIIINLWIVSRNPESSSEPK